MAEPNWLKNRLYLANVTMPAFDNALAHWVVLIAGSTGSVRPSSYSAEDGEIYTAQVSIQGKQALQIQGCVPNGGLGGSETWTTVKWSVGRTARLNGERRMGRNPWPVIIMTKYCFVDAPLLRGVRATLPGE